MTLLLYLLRILGTRTMAALFVLTTLYLVFDLIEAWRFIDRAGGGLPLILNYLRDRAATALWYVLPAALLVGTMLGFGALSQRGELVAMGSAGVGPARLYAPSLVIAMLCVGASYAIGELWLPDANRGIDTVYRAALAGDAASSGKRSDLNGFHRRQERSKRYSADRSPHCEAKNHFNERPFVQGEWFASKVRGRK